MNTMYKVSIKLFGLLAIPVFTLVALFIISNSSVSAQTDTPTHSVDHSEKMFAAATITVSKDGAPLKNSTVIAFDQSRDTNDLGSASFDHIHSGNTIVKILMTNAAGEKVSYSQTVDVEERDTAVTVTGEGTKYDVASASASITTTNSSAKDNSSLIVISLLAILVVIFVVVVIYVRFFSKDVVRKLFQNKKIRYGSLIVFGVAFVAILLVQLLVFNDNTRLFKIKDNSKAATATLPIPANVRVEADDQVATLKWGGLKDLNNPTGVSGYFVRWGKQANGFTDTKLTIYRAIQLQPLNPGVSYIAQVYSVDDYGNISAASSSVTFQSDPTRVNALRTQMNGFFDDFNTPQGDLDQTKWNFAASACTGKGLSTNFVNTQFHAHNLVGDRNCDRGQSVSRAREMLDLSQGTRTITYDFDGFASGGIDEWYLDIFGYNPNVPIRDLAEDLSIGDFGTTAASGMDLKKDPPNVLRIAQENSSDNSVQIHYFDSNGYKYKLPNITGSGVCTDLRFCSPEVISTITNVRRHWKVQVSKTEIIITIDNIKVADVSLQNTYTPTGLPFDKAYLQWNGSSYNTTKHSMGQVLIHWDNFGFDAPAGFTKQTVTHNYTNDSIGTSYTSSENSGMVIPNSTITVPIQKIVKIPDPIVNNAGASPKEIRVKYTMESSKSGTGSKDWGGFNGQEYITVNGTKVMVPNLVSAIPNFPFQFHLAGGYATYTQSIVIPASYLKVGDNVFEIALNNCGVMNFHVEIDYPNVPNLVYTQPINIYPDYKTLIFGDFVNNLPKPGAGISSINGTKITTKPTLVANDLYTKKVDTGLTIGNSVDLGLLINTLPYTAASGSNNGIKNYDIYVDRKIVFSQNTFANYPGLGDIYSPEFSSNATVNLSSLNLCNGTHELFIRAYDADGVASFPDYYHTNYIDTFDYFLQYYPLNVTYNSGSTTCDGSQIPPTLPPLYPTTTITPTPSTTASTTSTTSATTTVPVTTSATITAPQGNVTGIGIIGDSLSDEYKGDDNRGTGTPYSSTTLNWMEQMAKNGSANFGSSKPISGSTTWGGTRRYGYEYNWAQSGADSNDMITYSQPPNLAGQISSGKVNTVVIWIGANDFIPKVANFPDRYGAIYNGVTSGAALTTKVNKIISNITAAVNTIQGAGSVKLMVIKVADYGFTPYVKSNYTDASKRQLVTNAINQVNAGIDALASSKNFPTYDVNSLFTQLNSQASNGIYTYSGVQLNLNQASYEPHAAFLGDGIHPGTIAQGIISNAIVSTLNTKYSTGLTTLTSNQILQDAGLVAGTTTTPVTTTPVTTTATTTAATTSPVTTTINPGCLCGGNGMCSASCSFVAPINSSTNVDATKMKCTRSAISGVAAVDGNALCNRSYLSQGDADGLGTVDPTTGKTQYITYSDYLWYLRYVTGGTIPSNISPDFNGDGVVDRNDLTVITNTLAAGL